MRIAIVVDKFPTVSETWVVNHACTLIDEGYEVTILAFSKGEVNYPSPILNKYRLLERTLYFQFCEVSFTERFKLLKNIILNNFNKLNFYSLFQSFNFFRSIKSALNLSNAFLAQWFLINKFDVIHAHYGHNGAFVSNLKSKKIIGKRVKILTSFHGYDLRPSEKIRLKKEYSVLMDYCDQLIVNSTYSKQLLEQLIGESSKIVILPVGTNTELFRNINTTSSSQTFRIVFCARLVEVKGPEVCLEIFKLFKERNPQCRTQLWMIGDGVLKGKLSERIEALNLIDHVRLLGAQAPSDIVELFNQCDLFLLPGVHEKTTGIAETQGLVIQEAQACELPVIVSNIGGMKYGLINEITGFLVEEGNIEMFVSKIEFLCKNKNVRLSMGKEGRKFVEKNFDLKVIKNKQLSLYIN